MLSLTRRVEETVLVYYGHKKIMEITISAVRGKTVRLGLDAPQEISFVRSELVTHAEKIQRPGLPEPVTLVDDVLLEEENETAVIKAMKPA